MKRGDVVIAAMRGEFTGKPRPYVVVQGNWALDAALTITLCPITTTLLGIGRIRIPVSASAENGLADDSEIEVDRVTTMRRSNITATVGSLPQEIVRRLDRSLKNWLDL